MNNDKKQIKFQVSQQTYSDNWDAAFSRTFKRKIHKTLEADANKVIKELNKKAADTKQT
ncbi:MAG: hypothetical protein KAI17_17810 [Thiotrichaceae bacterium]|nr:hypothetical protein [Thiotrichaceae bacterium]